MLYLSDTPTEFSNRPTCELSGKFINVLLVLNFRFISPKLIFRRSSKKPSNFANKIADLNRQQYIIKGLMNQLKHIVVVTKILHVSSVILIDCAVTLCSIALFVNILNVVSFSVDFVWCGKEFHHILGLNLHKLFIRNLTRLVYGISKIILNHFRGMVC